MKTNLPLLIISFFITWISFGQLESLELSDIITIDASAYTSEGNALTVPVDKIWVIHNASPSNCLVRVKVKGGSSFVKTQWVSEDVSQKKFIYTEGMQFFVYEEGYEFPLIQILEYKAPTGFDGALAIEESSLPKEKLLLYPNPTGSELTINSDKIFKVVVFDLNGRKVFETKSTSIDFSELKTGIYLVNLYDDINRLVSTYKVIRN